MKLKITRITVAIAVLLLAILLPGNEIFSTILFVVAYIIAGYDIVFKALNNIIRGNFFDEFFLMSLATIGAFVLKEYEEAVAVMIFFQLGEFFQTLAVEKSRKSILGLMDLKPEHANLVLDDQIIIKKPEEIEVGSTLLVKPGEKIPLDGIIVEGSSSLNTASLTGESLPREVKLEDEVLSGSINLSSPIKVKTTTTFAESTVMKILDMVENATMRKAKSEKFITKFAHIYTPIVVLCAVILAFVPPLILGFSSNFSIWLYRAFTFLLVSCPCALVLSIPLSYFAGIGACAKHHILIKGSNYLESLANVNTIAMDKTGTITKGNFHVAEVSAIFEEDELLRYACIAEQMSNHPIAIAIKEYHKCNQQADKVEEIPGYGMKVLFQGKVILAGNARLMDVNDVSYDKPDLYGSIVFVAVDGVFQGYIRITDEIKENAKKAISYLKKCGINEIVMLTGDQKKTAEYISKEVSISSYYAELLPQDKVSVVEDLKKKCTEKEKLAFVGDGINDAPVLAMADVGISMGGLGSDAAIEASDMVLLKDDLLNIYDGIMIAKKTRVIVMQNIILSLVIKLAVLILASVGVGNMILAIFADVGVCLLAVANAMRCLYYHRKDKF